MCMKICVQLEERQKDTGFDKQLELVSIDCKVDSEYCERCTNVGGATSSCGLAVWS